MLESHPGHRIRLSEDVHQTRIKLTNGRLYSEVQFALPRELDASGRRALAGAFAERVCGGERLPYTLALHKGEAETPDKPDNPHAHLMFSERGNDGIARSEEQWFKRHNPKAPGAWRGTQEPGGQGLGLAGQDPPGVGADGESGRWSRRAGPNGSTAAACPIGATRPTARATLSGRPS